MGFFVVVSVLFFGCAVVLFSGVLWLLLLLLLLSCRLAVVVVALMFVGVPSLFLDVVCLASLGSLLFDYCFWLPVVVLLLLLFSCCLVVVVGVRRPFCNSVGFPR